MQHIVVNKNSAIMDLHSSGSRDSEKTSNVVLLDARCYLV